MVLATVSAEAFAQELVAQVQEFCRNLEDRLPMYSYIPCTSDEQRLKVLRSRCFNEVRAAEVFGAWLKTTPEPEVKAALGEAIHEEFEHAELLGGVLRGRDIDPYAYRPLPAQMAMFNAFEALPTTVERMAAFPLAGEGVATFLIAKALTSANVPDWLKAPYRAINEDESEHGGFPERVLARYAVTLEQQEAARRAVAMSLLLRRQYFDNLDRWVVEDRAY
jgi:hypothetical protein